MRFPDLWTGIGHFVFGCGVLLAVRPNLRPLRTMLRLDAATSEAGSVRLDVPLATLTLSLLTFNAIFAVENALDLAFL